MSALSLSPEAAYEALAAFARRCGRGPLELAMHAAVPDGFRLDVLPLLRRNFLPGLSTDTSADADLLLAPFCEHLGNDYFQLDPETRRLLLDQLAVTYGENARPRLPRVAAFLLAYVERAERSVRSGEDRVLQAYLEIQRWNALGFLDPSAAARALAEAIVASGADAVRVRLGTVAAVLNLPLGPYYRRFIEYTLGVDALSRGDQQQARSWLAPFEQQPPQIEGVKLKSFQELMPPAPEQARTSKVEREKLRLTTIYLSSTYEDLKEHRRAVVDALRKYGYQVIGMEDYVARDDRPVAVCLEDVDQADIYVGLFAFRYGYIPLPEHGNPNGLSITELEFRRAEDSPTTSCLVFLLDEETPWPPQYFDTEDGGVRIHALREELARKKLVGFFRSPQELASQVQAAVSKYVQTAGTSNEYEPAAPVGPDALRAAVERMTKPHRRFEGSVEWALTELGVSIDHRPPEGTTGGKRHTHRKVWAGYGDHIAKWSTHYGVPAKLILATIWFEVKNLGLQETLGKAHTRVSSQADLFAHPTQARLDRARDVLQYSDVNANWLLDPGNAIQADTAFIASQFSLTGFDPPLVACALYTGGIHPDHSPDNRWRIRQSHIGTSRPAPADAFVGYVNDCFGLFAELEASGSMGDIPQVSLRRLVREMARAASSETETDGIDVFLSYAREDADRADRLVRTLEERGWTVWIDRERVADAQAWEREAKQAHDRARCVVVLITPHSLASRWVAEEIDHARDRGVLIPVLLTPPGELKQLPKVDLAQGVDLSGWTGNLDHPGLRQLFSAVQRVTARSSDTSTDETERLLRDLKDLETSHQRRAVIGDRLAKLGDPRSGVGLRLDGTPDIDWVGIPGGNVQLENIAAEVRVVPLQISRYLVSNAQFQGFVRAEDGYANAGWWQDLPSDANDGPIIPSWPENNRPRENVSWYEAVAFYRWLSARLGYTVRLPNEFEWQQAATGGDAWREYPWGEWEEGRCNSRKSGLRRTSAVGLYPHGTWSNGPLDMAGNVWEWCLNKFRDPMDDRIDRTGGHRVLRGGCWLDGSKRCRVAFRDISHPGIRNVDIGFRLLRPPSSDD